MKKVINFIKEVVTTAEKKVVSFFKGLWDHLASVAVITLAPIGLSSLIGELPFIYLLPMWVEGPLVIPVFSVLAIAGLLKIAEWQQKRLEARNALAT